jgi:sugar phosphate isomerase/epimerase
MDSSFRLGTTSYIIPADILPNVRYLAGQVRDVELVLFEVDDGPNNLPSPSDVAELGALARQHDLTYTVHLPLDLRLAAGGGEQHVSLFKARKVIECTRALDPWAYVLHLDGKEYQQDPATPGLSRWQAEAVRALELVAAWAGDPQRLAVENLDGYPPEFWTPVLERVPVSRCIDVGHLWKDGIDPLPFLERHLNRTRVIHIHGIGTRDHQSLSHMPPDQIHSVFTLLAQRQYSGVVTLEVFGEEDFHSSLEAIRLSILPTSAGQAFA